MLVLSHKYLQATNDDHKLLLAAAGETMLAKGSHGSLGVFLGFVMIPFSNGLISCVMVRGKVFSSLTSYFGIIGNSLMVIYVIVVTFIPAVDKLAFVVAICRITCDGVDDHVYNKTIQIK